MLGDVLQSKEKINWKKPTAQHDKRICGKAGLSTSLATPRPSEVQEGVWSYW